MALNDEDVKVRGLAIEVAGRLSVKNPAYVMPQLRRHLMQLLNDMDHSPDSLQREGVQHWWLCYRQLRFSGIMVVNFQPRRGSNLNIAI